MILGREAILEAIESGLIRAENVDLTRSLQACHIDVTVGASYYRCIPNTNTLDLVTADPNNWMEPFNALDGKILMPPHSYILAHTQEAIGSTDKNIIPCLQTRSTFARWGLSVCTANAGWGDPGYVGVWTLEIVNNRPQSVYLPVGARVGCISFSWVDGNDVLYQDRYNNTLETWEAAMMLPRTGNW